jgi:hypothetical protein
MFKFSAAIVAIAAALAFSGAAMAACTLDDAMTKSGAVSEALTAKLSAKPDAVAKMMSEMGEIMGTGDVNEQTCTKLDALAARAAKI